MAISLSVKPLGNVNPSTDFIFGVLDGANSKLFGTSSYTATTSAPTLSSTTFTSAVSPQFNLPKAASISQVAAADPSSGKFYTGQFVLTLTPDAADVVNASSPMSYVFSPNAQALVNGTAS